MKKLITALLGIFLAFTLIGTISANTSGQTSATNAGSQKRLVDQANLLSDDQKKELMSLLDEISERQKCDVVIVTVKNLGGKTAEAFADDYFDYNGYGQGEDFTGLLLLLSMKERDWHISTTGYAIKAFTDAGMEYMSDKFVPKLSDGDYYEAFTDFAELCDKFLTQAKTDKPYDVGNLPKEPFSWIWIPIAIAVGLVIAFVAVSAMAGQLKSVEPDLGASNYIDKNSLNITTSQQDFIRSIVNKVERPKEEKESGGSSTHTSSSGRTHGGSGGKF